MLKIENIKYEKADMRFVRDLRKRKFGRLTVLDNEPIRINNQTYWKCKCECGDIGYVMSSNLTKEKIRSCGCLLNEHRKELYKYNIGIEKKRKYPKNAKRLLFVYQSIKSRCYNEKNKYFKNYGARGIKICDEWLKDFMNFYNWAIINGYDFKAKRGKFTIDRIDVNGNYEPNNCRFISIEEQQNNRTNNRLITINGQTKTMAEWAHKLDISYEKFRSDCNKKGL